MISKEKVFFLNRMIDISSVDQFHSDIHNVLDQ